LYIQIYSIAVIFGYSTVVAETMPLSCVMFSFIQCIP